MEKEPWLLVNSLNAYQGIIDRYITQSAAYGVYPVETKILQNIYIYLERSRNLIAELLAQKAERDKGYNTVCPLCLDRYQMVDEEPCRNCYNKKTEEFENFRHR